MFAQGRLLAMQHLHTSVKTVGIGNWRGNAGIWEVGGHIED